MSKNTTQNQNKTETTSVNPEQQGYLTDAWKQAQGLFGNSTNNTYKGDLIAQLTPEQLSNYRGMFNFANTSDTPGISRAFGQNAAATGTQLGQTGNAMTGQMGDQLLRAQGVQDSSAGLFNAGQQMFGQGNQLVRSGAGTTGAGTNAMMSAIRGLGSFTPTGGANSNIADAAKYADNPFMSGQVDAAMRDARRSVSEQALPQIARDAALSGNIGSSKRGIAEGVVERGLAEKTADVSAGLRGDAYSQGIKTAEGARQFNNSAMLDALKSRSGAAGQLADVGIGQTGQGINAFGAGTAAANAGTGVINAGTGITNSGTGIGNLGLGFNGAGLDANKFGADAYNTGLQQQLGLFGLANQAGAGMQGGNQLGLDNARSKIEYGNQQPWDALARYYGIVGSNNWGGTKQTNGTTKTEESDPMSLIGAGLGGAASLFGANGLNFLSPMGKAFSSKLFG